MTQWELAQLNIARLLAPVDSPVLVGFVSELDRINTLADQSPGFVWRLQSQGGNATEIQHPFGEGMIVNMSVWDSVESLHNYTYRTAHTQIMSKRKQWFERMTDAYTVLWWVPRGHRPTTAEAQARLNLLRNQGPTAEAFTFKCAYDKPSTRDSNPIAFDDECPAL